MEASWLLNRYEAERGGPSLAHTGCQRVRRTRRVGGMIERLDSALYLTGLARENRRGLAGRIRQRRSRRGLCYGYEVIH